MIKYIGDFNTIEKEFVEEQLDVDAIVIKQNPFYPLFSINDILSYMNIKLEYKNYKLYYFNKKKLQEIITPAIFVSNIAENVNKKYLPEESIVYIQQGCSENCICTSAYKCKFSVPFEDIKLQIMDLPQDEIISLYGINVGDYNYNNMNIIDLCKKILEYFPNRKIILCNISPFSPILKELVNYINNEPRIFNYLYMCINSGSQKILDIEGHKNYNNNLLDILKDTNIKIIPYLIVGSPEEDENDFNDTLKWVKKHSDIIAGAIILPYTINGIGNTNQTISFEELKHRIIYLNDYINNICFNNESFEYNNIDILNLIEIAICGEDHKFYRRYGFACI